MEKIGIIVLRDLGGNAHEIVLYTDYCENTVIRVYDKPLDQSIKKNILSSNYKRKKTLVIYLFDESWNWSMNQNEGTERTLCLTATKQKLCTFKRVQIRRGSLGEFCCPPAPSTSDQCHGTRLHWWVSFLFSRTSHRVPRIKWDIKHVTVLRLTAGAFSGIQSLFGSPGLPSAILYLWKAYILPFVHTYVWMLYIKYGTVRCLENYIKLMSNSC